MLVFCFIGLDAKRPGLSGFYIHFIVHYQSIRSNADHLSNGSDITGDLI